MTERKTPRELQSRIYFRVEPEVLKQIKLKTVMEETSIQDVFEGYAEQYIKN